MQTKGSDNNIQQEIKGLAESAQSVDVNPHDVDPHISPDSTGNNVKLTEMVVTGKAPETPSQASNRLDAIINTAKDAKKGFDDELTRMILDSLRPWASGNVTNIPFIQGPLAPFTDPLFDRLEAKITTGESKRSKSYNYASATVAIGSLLTPGIGEEEALARAPALVKRAARSRVYSVAVGVKLETRWGKGIPKELRRKFHRIEAQDEIYKQVQKLLESVDPAEKEAGNKLSKLLSKSEDWHIHHSPFREGAMELVPKVQHQAKQLQDLFHPYINKFKQRVGGFKIWGHKF